MRGMLKNLEVDPAAATEIHFLSPPFLSVQSFFLKKKSKQTQADSVRMDGRRAAGIGELTSNLQGQGKESLHTYLGPSNLRKDRR